MMRRCFAVLGLTLALGAQAATDLPLARDLRSEADSAAQAGAPLIVIFSRKDCKFCETVKRDYLKPLSADPRHAKRVVIRQVDQDSERALVDFRGEATTHARFAASERVKLVPVVAFYGPQGRRLADPIVGARLPDFYASYLEEGIARSEQMLKARPAP